MESTLSSYDSESRASLYAYHRPRTFSPSFNHASRMRV
jgi:hypothetical protein